MSVTQPNAAEAWKIRIAPRTARDWDRANAQRIGQLARAQPAADLRAATGRALAEQARIGAAAVSAHAATSRRRRIVEFAEDALIVVVLGALVAGACTLFAAVWGGVL